LAPLALVVSASIVFNGMAVCSLLIVAGGAFLLFDRLYQSETEKAISHFRKDIFSALLSLSAVALFSSGTIARPLYLTNPPLDITWIDLWISASSVVSTESTFSLLPFKLIYVLASLVGLLWVAIIFITICQRKSEAAALLLGTACIALVLTITGQKWKFYETLSIYIPAAICAVGIALNDQSMVSNRNRAVDIFLPTFAAAIIVLGLGRFVTTLVYTVGPKAYSPFTFSLSEFDRLTAIVREAGGAYIDTSDVSMTAPLVLEFTKRSIPFHLSPRSWKAFLGYRPWEVPEYSPKYTLTIVDKMPSVSVEGGLLNTTQYSLLTQSNN
jgi:hypothetical protein